MAWAKIADDFYDDPKIVGVGNEAVGAFVRMIAYCAKHSTDGYVPVEIARAVAKPAVLKRLGDAGLVVDVVEGELQEVLGRRDSGRRKLEDVLVRCPGAGVFVPKYVHYNPSRLEAEQARERGRKEEG